MKSISDINWHGNINLLYMPLLNNKTHPFFIHLEYLICFCFVVSVEWLADMAFNFFLLNIFLKYSETSVCLTPANNKISNSSQQMTICTAASNKNSSSST